MQDRQVTGNSKPAALWINGSTEQCTPWNSARKRNIPTECRRFLRD